ncbi:3-succinoylsemialdehyde-pyridine dehydrogenase [Burkholderia cepacia]|nr:3-succinoylsemialdehyde-pyridine dehydrogenase [Burkholderia cepacia]
MKIYDQFYIDGAWRKPAGTGTIDVIDSGTEAVIGRIPEGVASDAQDAIRAARAAFDAWAATPASTRAGYLRKIVEHLQARSEELAQSITGEVGMPIKLSRAIQVGGPIYNWKAYAKLAESFEFEAQVGNSLVVREPVGVVAAITPWNYPLNQVTLKVAPALAAGCTVVLKPSEVAPLNAFMLAEAIHEAGLPAGVFNLVCGYGPVVGEVLATDPDVDMVSFTGSTRAGKRVAELAAAGASALRSSWAASRVGDPRRCRFRDGGEGHGQRVLPERGADLLGAHAHAGSGSALRRSARDREGRGRIVRRGRPAAGCDASRRACVGRAAAARAGLHPARDRRRR